MHRGRRGNCGSGYSCWLTRGRRGGLWGRLLGRSRRCCSCKRSRGVPQRRGCGSSRPRGRTLRRSGCGQAVGRTDGGEHGRCCSSSPRSRHVPNSKLHVRVGEGTRFNRSSNKLRDPHRGPRGERVFGVPCSTDDVKLRTEPALRPRGADLLPRSFPDLTLPVFHGGRHG